jgi:outer membrane lipoprotein carrier protein
MTIRAGSLSKALFVAALALGISLTAGHAREASAQDAAPTAATVAAWAQTFYDRTPFVQARFSQYFWNRVYDRTSTSRGQIFISRPGRVRFDYAAPSGKVVVSDGEHFTYYEPGDDGAVGQYYEGSADSTSAALGFLTGTARLDRDFTFTLRAHSDTQPAETQALELRPRHPDPHYRRVVLYVSEAAATRGVVRRISIEDPDGNWNRFDFSGFDLEHPIDAARFEYTPPAGARRIDPPS